MTQVLIEQLTSFAMLGIAFLMYALGPLLIATVILLAAYWPGRKAPQRSLAVQTVSTGPVQGPARGDSAPKQDPRWLQETETSWRLAGIG